MSTPLIGLYAITDSQLMQTTQQLCNSSRAALEGGVKILQYRDKTNNHALRREQALALRNLCQDYNAALIINDDVDLAIDVAADGIHLGQSDGDLIEARKRLGPEAIIGVTCHDSLAFAKKAEADSANYVAFGAFFKSNTKPNAKPAPMSLLADANSQLTLPIVAIGGITVDNAHQLITKGCHMVAVVHSLFAADDVTKRARAFSALFTQTS